MKHNLLLHIFLLLLTYGTAQNIERSCIINNEIYWVFTETILYAGDEFDNSKLGKYKLQRNEYPYITHIGDDFNCDLYKFPHCWSIRDSTVFTVSVNMPKHYLVRFSFRERILCDLDSAKKRIAIREFIKKYSTFSEQIRYNDSIRGDKEIFIKSVMPISWLFKKHINAQIKKYDRPWRWYYHGNMDTLEMRDITYDFYWQQDNEFMFFVRDDAMLTQWHYNYPNETVRGKPEDWNEVRTYTWQPKGNYEKQDTMPYLPSGKKHIYNAFADTLANFMLTDSSFVKLKYLPDTTLAKLQKLKEIPFVNDSIYRRMLRDSVGIEEVKQYYTQIKQAGNNLFFKGHFNAIRQGNQIFIVNLQYGGIYCLGAKEVVRVGQFDVNNYPKKLFGKQLFIDDRDNERLIFFAPVQRLNTDKPFPEIFVPSDEEFREIFKYVIN